MNERLKALMLEAGYAAPEIATRGHVLAELIVRECATIADEQCVIATDHVFGVGQELLDHFGVDSE
jgi:hypothetical protein